MAAKRLNQMNFENEILKAKGVSVVDFYADWCGPCKMLGPVIDEIAKEQEGINVGKVNVDENPELVVQYNVMSIPAVVIMKDGKESARFVGFRSKQDILRQIGEVS